MWFLVFGFFAEWLRHHGSGGAHLLPTCGCLKRAKSPKPPRPLALAAYSAL